MSASADADKKNGEDTAADLAETASDQKRSELSILKQSLDDARGQSAATFDQLVRLKADFENFRRRADKEKADSRRFGKEEIILRLVSLMDVMEQAEKAAHASHDMKSVVAGLDMLYKEFKRLLKDEGLEEVDAPVGAPFDPQTQEAVEMVPGEDPGKVLGVLQKGYKFGGALLRPARVKVSESPESTEDKI